MVEGTEAFVGPPSLLEADVTADQVDDVDPVSQVFKEHVTLEAVEKAGVLTELRRREHFDKPSVRRKKKAAAARKRALKKLKRMAR